MTDNLLNVETNGSMNFKFTATGLADSFQVSLHNRDKQNEHKHFSQPNTSYSLEEASQKISEYEKNNETSDLC